jgi:hypothetical protein
LPQQDLRYAKWQKVVGSLLGAAHTGRADIISIATEQPKQALLTPPFTPARLANDTPAQEAAGAERQASSKAQPQGEAAEVIKIAGGPEHPNA